MMEEYRIGAEFKFYKEHILSLLSDVPNANYVEEIRATCDLKDLVPLFRSGVLLSLLLNSALDGMIPDDVINWKIDSECLSKIIEKRNTESTLNPEETKTLFAATENLNKFIEYAKKTGIIVVNISAEDILDVKVDLILGLIWQIVRLAMFKDINLLHHPELIRLMEAEENVVKFINIADEELLVRWVNWHLAAAQSPRRLRNLSRDELKDGLVLLHIFKQVVPKYEAQQALRIVEQVIDLPTATDRMRLDAYIKACRLINCRMLFNVEDLLCGGQRPYLLSIAALFNKYTGIHLPSEEEVRALLSSKHELERKNSELTKALEEMKAKLRIVSQSCEETMDSFSTLKLSHSELEITMREEERKLIVALEEKAMKCAELEDLLKDRESDFDVISAKMCDELYSLKNKAKECYQTLYCPALTDRVVSVLSRSQLSMNFNKKSNPTSPKIPTPVNTPLCSPDKNVPDEENAMSDLSDADSSGRPPEKCLKYIESVHTLISQITEAGREHEKNLGLMIERLDKLSRINDLMAKKICEYTESRMRERKK